MNPIRTRFLTTFAFPLAAACVAPAASADERWMAYPSYYSHAVAAEYLPLHPVPVVRAAYRPAVVSPYPGFSVRSGYRVNRVTIRSGSSRDTTVLGGAFFEARP